MDVVRELNDFSITEHEAFEKLMENPQDRSYFWLTYKIHNPELKKRLLLTNIHESFIGKLIFGLPRKFMHELFNRSQSIEVRREAFYFMPRTKEVLQSVLNNPEENWHIRFDALTSISDENILLDFVLRDDDILLIKTAVSKIDSEDLLLKIITSPINPRARICALRKIRSDYSQLFAELVLKESNYYLQETFLQRIYDPQILFQLVVELDDFSLKMEAISRIRNLDTLLSLRMLLSEPILISFIKVHIKRVRSGILN